MTTRMILLFAMGIAVLFIIAILFANSETKKTALRISGLLQRIEQKYKDLVEKQINYSVLNNNSIDLDPLKFTAETLSILKPDIDGLVAQLNATTYSRIKIDVSLEVFSNLAPVCESSLLHKKKEINLQQKEELLQVIKDSILSDLSQRKLKLLTGI